MPNTSSRRMLLSALAAGLMLTSMGPAVAQGCGGVEVFAHRGSKPGAENTVAAIQASAKQGFSRAEIDIQLTRDGVWVLHHDATTGRVVRTARPMPVAMLTSGEWSRASVVGTGSPGTFAEALQAAQKAGIGLEVEIKMPANCQQVGQALNMAGSMRSSIRWTSAFKETARCLSSQAGSGTYVGLIVGPPGESQAVAAPANQVADLARRFGASESLIARGQAAAGTRYEDMASRTFVSPDGLKEAARLLGSGRNRGIHVPASDIASRPALTTYAEGAGLQMVAYADKGDRHLAKLVASVPGISAAVIDGQRDAFCRDAR